MTTRWKRGHLNVVVVDSSVLQEDPCRDSRSAVSSRLMPQLHVKARQGCHELVFLDAQHGALPVTVAIIPWSKLNDIALLETRTEQGRN